MEEKNTIFDYITGTFATYGVMVSVFILLGLILGNYIGDYSSLFRFGAEGLSIPTLLQLLLLAALTTLAQSIFLTDRWIKNMTIFLRKTLFFIIVMVLIAVLIVLFDWFPVNDLKAWVGFFLSYTVSMTISVMVTRLRERAENDKMQEALDKYNKR